jgi:hypothetical protein
VSAVLGLVVLRADAHHDADELAEAESPQFAAAERWPGSGSAN